MKILSTSANAFLSLLDCFDEKPKLIPVSSIMVLDDTKPISLVLIYHDAGMIFIHGLFKARSVTNREFFKSIKVIEAYIKNNLPQDFGVVTFTKLNCLKNIFKKVNAKSETVNMITMKGLSFE